MNATIISLSPEELEQRISSALQKTLENYAPATSNSVTYLTRKEVSEKLHISLPTLHEYSKTGVLTAYRINGRVLYREDEVEAALTATEPLKYRRK